MNNDWFDSHCIRVDRLERLREIRRHASKPEVSGGAEALRQMREEAQGLVSGLLGGFPTESEAQEARALLQSIEARYWGVVSGYEEA